jgi:hypothetical protein
MTQVRTPAQVPAQTDAIPPARQKRGFAAMDPAAQRQIASSGGRAAHASGKAHQFTSEEARVAGAKKRKRPVQTAGTIAA